MYKLWDLSDYSFLYELKNENIEEIKMRYATVVQPRCCHGLQHSCTSRASLGQLLLVRPVKSGSTSLSGQLLDIRTGKVGGRAAGSGNSRN